MDGLTRWIEDNEAEILETAILSAFADGVQLHLRDWIFRVRKSGDHMSEADGETFLGAEFDPLFSSWLSEKVRAIEVEVESSFLGLKVSSKWNDVTATVIVTREELDLSSENKEAFRLLCEVQALRVLATWAEHAKEKKIYNFATSYRADRNNVLNTMHMEMIREHQAVKAVVDQLCGVQPSALTQDLSE